MKRPVSSRRGSALLIVLGMLSFMVVSAVAFSVFMRENRLPSSFLRQKIVSNHLVKAALAHAMNEIDCAIGSHPYPGVTAKGESRGGTEKNYWKNRIFMGVSGEGLEEWSDDTVSTLTLEGLAYLPPPLINTARYWSRRTPTAQWKPLSYDAGRYAYTAINVSDYLDLNRSRASVMRDSSVSNRISFAYMFENESHTGAGSSVNPQSFDNFIKKTRDDNKYKSRLVSLADYNLAIGQGKSKYGDIGFKSPFCEYFLSSEGDGLIYGDVSLDTIKRQQFVTDSWYPAPIATNDVYYLTDEQPFDGIAKQASGIHPTNIGGDVYKRIYRQMDAATFCALRDYIDDDGVPSSLAQPTLERTPMLTGLSFQPAGFAIQMVSDDVETAPKTEKKPATHRRTWKLKTLGSPAIACAGCGVYPFKRSSGRGAQTSYDVEVMIKCFFSSTDFNFDSTRLTGSLSLRPTDLKDWKEEYALAASDKAYIKIIAKGKASVNSSCEEEDDCLVNVRINNGQPIKINQNAVDGLGVMGLTYLEGEEAEAVYDNTGIEKPLYYYNANGAIVSISEKAPDVALRLNFAAWIRIIDNDGNTVDLVPATLYDDAVYNDVGGSSILRQLGSSTVNRFSGNGEPVLPFKTETLLTINEQVFRDDGLVRDDRNAGIEQSPDLGNGLSIYCDDPRFNFAPEDWYQTSGGAVSGSTWLSAAQSRCDGDNGRQRDIFQFVSDCGYLQSMGELQFLPNLDSNGFRRYPQNSVSLTYCTYLGNPAKYNGSFAPSLTETANADFSWRTHWAFGNYADWERGSEYSPYNWGILDAPDGAVVTPYSASDDLLMAGLANTPYDWTVAGYAADGEFTYQDIAQYCFNGYGSSEAQLKWDDLTKIAQIFRERFQAGEGWDADLEDGDPRDSWNECWYGGQGGEDFFGEDVAALGIHDVDRKFLYSFWKNCFGDRQQLFLVFVRAEPSVLGGGTGRTPAQLGARAVALVWRDPATALPVPSGSNVPAHRMRILFYHQFD